MQPFELATMIAIVVRPKTPPPKGERIPGREPEPIRDSGPVSPFRRAIGFWLIGLGGAVAGR